MPTAPPRCTSHLIIHFHKTAVFRNRVQVSAVSIQKGTGKPHRLTLHSRLIPPYPPLISAPRVCFFLTSPTLPTTLTSEVSNTLQINAVKYAQGTRSHMQRPSSLACKHRRTLIATAKNTSIIPRGVVPVRRMRLALLFGGPSRRVFILFVSYV